MNLTFDEGNLFYDLYAALLSFVNRKLEVSLAQFSDSREYTCTPPEARVAMLEILALASGSRGMAGGQALDLAATTSDQDLDLGALDREEADQVLRGR